MRSAVFAPLVILAGSITTVISAREVNYSIYSMADPTYNHLGDCGKSPYVSDRKARACLDNAVASNPEAEESNGPAGVFWGSVNSDLDQLVENRILHSRGSKTRQRAAYRAWLKRTTSDCEATSQFSTGGSGLGADIGSCTAEAQVVLLQKGLNFRYRHTRVQP